MIAAIASIILLAAAPVEGDRSATPRYRPIPKYPSSCMPKAGEAMKPNKVVVVYTVTLKGTVEGVRVRETTDPCFNETAIAAARSWRFEPAIANGVAVDQEDFETTISFIAETEIETQDFDARPLKRMPPIYPAHCMEGAKPTESVFVEFDVTAEGKTANIRVVETTNRCLRAPAIASVRKWIYRPKVEGGQAVERKGVQTVITFELRSGRSDPPYRAAVARKLNSVAAKLRSGRDPQEALADLADIEEEYGDEFTGTELRSFHQLRGAARLEAKDYRGALDDFRMIQQLGMGGETGEAVTQAIAQLEAYIAAEEAAAASATPDAGAEPSPEATSEKGDAETGAR